jgi:hypothetical protein
VSVQRNLYAVKEVTAGIDGTPDGQGQGPRDLDGPLGHGLGPLFIRAQRAVGHGLRNDELVADPPDDGVRGQDLADVLDRPSQQFTAGLEAERLLGAIDTPQYYGDDHQGRGNVTVREALGDPQPVRETGVRVQRAQASRRPHQEHHHEGRRGEGDGHHDGQASNANHDRVLGKSRFRTCASACKGTLVAVVTLDCSTDHSRQPRPRLGDDPTYGGTTCAFKPCNHRHGKTSRTPAHCSGRAPDPT